MSPEDLKHIQQRRAYDRMPRDNIDGTMYHPGRELARILGERHIDREHWWKARRRLREMKERYPKKRPECC